MPCSINPIVVGARHSPLAQVQVQEVLDHLRLYHPHVEFEGRFVASQGDKDQTTSLRTLDKTDFFTKEIDEMLLVRNCRIAIHSAKDLPSPLPTGLSIVAFTKGLDPSDVLVLAESQTIDTLPSGSLIATSSLRREEAVKELRRDLAFIDVRGTIAQRLALIDKGEAQGVVVAEAALIRLGLTHLNRITLPGDTAPLQGQLAVLARTDDTEMHQLFACLDARNTHQVLHVGLEVPERFQKERVVHCPFIAIAPRSKNNSDIQKALAEFKMYSHLVFTSKSAVSIFIAYAASYGIDKTDIQEKCIVAVGTATAKKIQSYGITVACIAQNETAEGIIEVFSKHKFTNPYVLWPHAAGARRVINEWFSKESVSFKECILYDTFSQRPHDLPNLSNFSEIFFTSPSTVDAFVEFYGSIPSGKILSTIGPITQKHLQQKLSIQIIDKA